MAKEVDSLLSALRLQGPGPGFAARTALAFEKARQQKRMRNMVLQLSVAAFLSMGVAFASYMFGWINPASMALKAGLALADTTMTVRMLRHLVLAAPALWISVLVAMTMASVATTIALERSVRWAHRS